MTKTKNVPLVDDYASFRGAFARMLDRHPGFRVVAQTGTLAEARGLAAQNGFE